MHRYLHILMCIPVVIFLYQYSSIRMEFAIHRIYSDVFQETSGSSLPSICAVDSVTQYTFLWIILFLLVNFLKFQCPPLYAVQSSDIYVFTLAFFFFIFFNSWTATIYRGKEELQIDYGSWFHLYPPKNMVARITLE